MANDSFAVLTNDIINCRLCPRLVAWREAVAADPPARYRGETYWARPAPGFGDPEAQVVIVGLAPAANGANRTGRMFTGDRSGDFLYASLYRTGFANQPEATDRNDGLQLKNAYIVAAVRCAPPQNKPTTAERDNCAPFLEREVALLDKARVYVALGKFGWDAVVRNFGVRPKPKFGHGAEVKLPNNTWLLGTYHPSQQNTFTGKLTEEMLDSVFVRSNELAVENH